MSAFAFSTVPVTASAASSALGNSIGAATEALLRARDEVISALDRQVVELQQLHSALASAPVMTETPEEEPYTPSFLIPETELSPAAIANSLFSQAPSFSGPPLPPMMNEAAPPAPQAMPPPMPPQAMPAPVAMPQMAVTAPLPEITPPMVMAQQVQAPPPPLPQAAPPPAPMPASPTPLPGLSWAASPPPAFMPSLSSVAASFVPPQQPAPPPELFAPAPPAPPMAASLPPPAPPVQEPPRMAAPLPPAALPMMAAQPLPPAPQPQAAQQRPGVTNLPPPRGGITFTTFKAPPPAPVRQPLVPPPPDFSSATPPPMPAHAHAGGGSAFAPLPLVESRIDPTLERATLEELNDALASAFSTVSRK